MCNFRPTHMDTTHLMQDVDAHRYVEDIAWQLYCSQRHTAQLLQLPLPVAVHWRQRVGVADDVAAAQPLLRDFAGVQ